MPCTLDGYGILPKPKCVVPGSREAERREVAGLPLNKPEGRSLRAKPPGFFILSRPVHVRGQAKEAEQMRDFA